MRFVFFNFHISEIVDVIEKQYDDFLVNIDQLNFFAQTIHDFRI